MREYTEIQKELISLADEPYRQFHSRLLPGTDHILGVRLPVLRKMAGRLLKEEGVFCLERLTDETYEELQLQGLIIGSAREDAGEKLERIRRFVDKIDNWAVCDTFCTSLRFTRKNQEKVLDFLKPYILSSREFEARFAAVMLLSWYADEAYILETLRLLDQIRQPDYYASMAVAWAVSVCYVKFPEITMKYLTEWNTLEEDTYRRALQKILESNRADQEQKRQIRLLREGVSRRESRGRL
ncbi:MAG: DNA alkylation repair protein [Clostridium sp.]|nr:DNA alkylation repair protein [Clostridium sp.]